MTKNHKRQMLWQCDNGTYDIIDGVDDETGEDCITHMNVPLSVLVAAPDLLAALVNALNVLAGIATGDLRTITPDSPAIAACRAAIAKAKGE